MRRIAIAAAKGGTGKTTTAVSLAHALALAGRRVLLVDCDPRRHAALHFGLAPERGLAAFLQSAPARAIEVRRGLRVLDSGGGELAELEARAGERPSGGERLLDRLGAFRDADFVLFDCPAHFGALQRRIVQVADEILLPLGADCLALASLDPALAAIEAARSGTEPAHRPRIVVTFYDARLESARWTEAQLAARGTDLLLQTRIRTSDALRIAAARHGSVFDCEPLSIGARDYAFLAEEIAPQAA